MTEKDRQTSGQLTLDLPPHPVSVGRSDYVISTSNEAAFNTGVAFLGSGDLAVTICGPEASGKTHLAHVLVEFVARSDGPESAKGFRIIDDLGHAGSPGLTPKELLENIEKAKISRERLILVGRGRPAQWADGLKDLVTRLEAMARITLDEPDEKLLSNVLRKLFADRQLEAPSKVVAFALARLPQTFAAARGFVEAMDAAALAGRHEINLPLARKIIDNLSEGDLCA